MKSFRWAALAALAVAAPASAQVTLNASSWISHQHPLVSEMLMPLCKNMETATTGRVRCNLLPKHPVAPPQTLDALREGVIDITFVTHGYTPGRFVLTEMAELPFLGDTAEATSVAYQRIYERTLAKYDEHKGIVVLAVFTHGPGTIYNTRKPIDSLKDLAGMKFRVGGSSVADVMTALGAVPMLKPASESYELLASGVADGVVLPKESALGFKLVPLIKHTTIVPGGLYAQSFAWAVNQAKWNAIPEADRRLMQPIFGEALARFSGKAWDAADAKGIAAVKDAGIPVRVASPAFIAEIKAKTEPLERAWIDKAKAKGVDAAATLKAFREEIGKLSR